MEMKWEELPKIFTVGKNKKDYIALYDYFKLTEFDDTGNPGKIAGEQYNNTIIRVRKTQDFFSPYARLIVMTQDGNMTCDLDFFRYKVTKIDVA